MLVPVYDIVSCGPRKRFVANGKLVHNSDRQNLQNLPRSSPLRHAMFAPRGYKLVICDLSQIEARMVAWLAGQDDLLTSFAEGRDVYSEFASEVYGRKITKENKTERFVGKVSILSLQYGVGANKFRNMLALGGVNIPIEEAQEIVNMYRNKYTRIRQFWNKCNHVLRNLYDGIDGELEDTPLVYDSRGIRLPNGLYLKYHELSLDEDGYRYVNNRIKGSSVRIYGAAVTENISQALARLVMSEHMLAIGKHYPVILQVHDEVIVLVSEHDIDNGYNLVQNIMSSAPAWADGLPVACEAGIGDSYGAGH